jgi:hypothetical protein
MPRKLAALAVPILVLTACGGTEIDAGKTEDLIRKSVTGPPPKTVECPDGIEAKKGETFYCDVTYDRGLPPASVTVHIEDDDGRIRVGPEDFRLRE